MDRNLKLLVLLSALCVRSVWADTTFYDTVTWDFGSSLIVNSGITAKFMPGSTVDATGATLVGFPGGTGASSFIGLTDAPHSYSGQAGNYVVVNPAATGLIFVTPPSGGGGTGTVTNFTAGNLGPLFNTSVTNPSTTPSLTFSLLNVGAGLFWGNETGVTAAPHYAQPSFANLSGDFALTQTPSLAAGSLVGRTSTGAGDWQPITVGTGLTMVGTNLSSVAGVVSAAAPSPSPDQVAVWTDATHIKGVKAITGGTTGQVLKKNSNTDYDYVWAADLIGGAGGATSFIGLSDVPSSYVGSGSKLVAVNSSENGLEFIAAPSGGGSVASVFGRTGVVTALVGDYSAFYQPLDSDLTAVAALTTTTFGRGFLTLADASSSRSYIGAGTSNFDGTWTSLTGKPTTLAGFGITDAQPLDGDLTAIAAVTGTNNLYYRSAANTWSSVTFGSNMTWGSGTLNAANTNWDTAYTDRMKWDGGATGLVPAAGRVSLALVVGTNVQAWDADLDSLAAASATGAMYYRSAANTWSPVTIGTGITFSGGTLTSPGGGDVSSNTSLSVDGEIVLFNGVTGKSVKRAVGSGIVTIASGVMGTITDNSSNWNTAFAQMGQWNGGATGLNATTGKISLGLNAVTNDVQAKASIYPNAVPTDGQIPVGITAAGEYFPRNITGVGATFALDNVGHLTVTNIANASLANSSMTIAGNSVALGGTVTLDAITGMSGLPAGIVKRNNINTFTNAVAGTDYKAATVESVNVRLITTVGTSTYTPTAGVTALYVEGVGGGGGGGGLKVTNTAKSAASSGGGGGGYSAAYIGTPLASYSVTVGAGGAAGTVTPTAGGIGGSTTFGTVLTATGGAGGQSFNTTGITGALWWGAGGSGGVGTVGGPLVNGSDGQGGCSLSGSTSKGGSGGASAFGGSTEGGMTTGVNQAIAGGTGAKYGGGGGGAGVTDVNAAAGGAGAQGMIRVWEIF